MRKQNLYYLAKNKQIFYSTPFESTHNTTVSYCDCSDGEVKESFRCDQTKKGDPHEVSVGDFDFFVGEMLLC